MQSEPSVASREAHVQAVRGDGACRARSGDPQLAKAEQYSPGVTRHDETRMESHPAVTSRHRSRQARLTNQLTSLSSGFSRARAATHARPGPTSTKPGGGLGAPRLTHPAHRSLRTQDRPNHRGTTPTHLVRQGPSSRRRLGRLVGARRPYPDYRVTSFPWLRPYRRHAAPTRNLRRSRQLWATRLGLRSLPQWSGVELAQMVAPAGPWVTG